MATLRAKQWRRGAKLTQVWIEIPARSGDRWPGVITYHFLQDSWLDRGYSWEKCLVTIDAYTGRVVSVVLILVWNLDAKVIDRPVEIEQIAIDYKDALRRADAAGGQELRAQHPDLRVEMQLYFGYWGVSYYLPGQEGEELSIDVDMVTGQTEKGFPGFYSD